MKPFLLRPFRALRDRYVGPFFAYDALLLALSAEREMTAANASAEAGA